MSKQKIADLNAALKLLCKHASNGEASYKINQITNLLAIETNLQEKSREDEIRKGFSLLHVDGDTVFKALDEVETGAIEESELLDFLDYLDGCSFVDFLSTANEGIAVAIRAYYEMYKREELG